MNNFNFKSYDDSKQNILLCDIDECYICNKLKQTIAEIKEFCIDHTQLIHDAYPYLNIILEKINEVEDV